MTCLCRAAAVIGHGHAAALASVGFAMEDFSTPRFVRDLTGETGLFSILDFLPRLACPKDLFPLVGGGPVAVRPRRAVPA